MKYFREKNGFTMIELLVAIGLFSIVVSIAAGGFVRALKTQSQIIGLISTNGNASLAIEQMAREIRTGTEFRCGIDCGTLLFKNADGKEVSYSSTEDENGRGVMVRGFENGEPKVITADNVNVVHLSFSLLGEGPGDGYPPRITISLGVSPVEKGVQGNVTNLETTVSARQIDG